MYLLLSPTAKTHFINNNSLYFRIFSTYTLTLYTIILFLIYFIFSLRTLKKKFTNTLFFQNNICCLYAFVGNELMEKIPKKIFFWFVLLGQYDRLFIICKERAHIKIFYFGLIRIDKDQIFRKKGWQSFQNKIFRLSTEYIQNISH